MSIEQLTIFDLLNNQEALPRNLKLLSLFSGIGAFEKALYNLGISYELINYCEIDKYASKSYSAIHGVSEAMNLWDVTKIRERDLLKDLDLLTYGFPCQDISLAGKQKGLFNDDGTKTRSGLFFDALRCIEAAQPRVTIAENVKNLTGKKFNAQFQVVLASLEAAGYNNYWAVLNLKDFGIPQNRERVFIVSIRKDLDKGLFEFPKGFPLEKRLKDVLEDTVDEKFYLSDKMIDHISQNGTKNYSNANCEINCAIARPLTTSQDKRAGTTNYLSENLPENFDINRIKVVGRINSSQDGVVVSSEGIAPTHTAGHGNTPKIVEPTLWQYPRGENKGGLLNNPYSPTITTNSWQHNCLLVESQEEPLAYDKQNQYVRQDGCVGTITTDGSSPKHNNRVLVYDGYNQRIRADQSCVGTITQNVGKDLKRNGQGIIEQPLRIRKLTPLECWRLMGFDDSDFHKAELVNSNTQLYKQAGNSIGVPVIEYIIKQLLKCEIWE